MMVFTKIPRGRNIIAEGKKGFETLKKRLIHLSFPDKLILLGSLIGFVSLFLEWIYFENMSHSSFHALTGANGYLLIVLILLLFASTLSVHYKNKLKLYSGLSFNDYHLAIIVGILLIILPINSTVFIHGLSTLSDAAHGNGIGLSITSGILVFAGAILKKRQLNSGDISLYMASDEAPSHQEDAQTKRDNMKLPF